MGRGQGQGTVHESLGFGLTFLERKQKYFFFCFSIFSSAYSGNVYATLRKKTFWRFYFLSAVENNALTSARNRKLKKVNENSKHFVSKSKKKLKLTL